MWQQSRVCVCGAVSQELDRKKGEKPFSHHISCPEMAFEKQHRVWGALRCCRVPGQGTRASLGARMELELEQRWCLLMASFIVAVERGEEVLCELPPVSLEAVVMV